jgi:hypothetical protein
LRSSEEREQLVHLFPTAFLTLTFLLSAPLSARPVGDAVPARIELPRQGFELIANARGVAAGREIPQLYSEICKLSLGSGKAGTCP